MASSLMSKDPFSPITLKHVVPWKTREEFILVYTDLYSDDGDLQQQAVHKINMWKSRAGSKLSVAIESTSCLTQGHLDYITAKRNGKLQHLEFQLRSTLSLAVIRFVNHITEKGQTKGAAQPVHLVAKEFDIPEWIVRLRHDATHNNLPSLDALVIATKWALNYLKSKFWDMQKADNTDTDFSGTDSPRSPKMAAIRAAVYDFQEVSFQALRRRKEGKETASESLKHTECLRTLQKYLNQNRMKFIKCLLEDGLLVSTEEQLAAFGIATDDLLHHLPPTIPVEMSDFWSSLLKKLHSSGCLALLLQTMVFSVGPQEGLRNYQLVAWLLYLITQGEGAKGKSKRKRKHDALFATPPPLPKKLLLTACLQNINTYTAFLLKHLVEKESLGLPAYAKLSKLLTLHTKTATHSGTSEDSDTDDTVYTVEDLRKASAKSRNERRFSNNAMDEIENSVEKSDIPWKLCTDLVDWSTIPFGTIPTSHDTESEGDSADQPPSPPAERDRKKRTQSNSSDDNEDDGDTYHHQRRLSQNRSSDEEEDDDDDEDELLRDGNDSDDNRRSSKRSKYLASDDIL